MDVPTLEDDGLLFSRLQYSVIMLVYTFILTILFLTMIMGIESTFETDSGYILISLTLLLMFNSYQMQSKYHKSIQMLKRRLRAKKENLEAVEIQNEMTLLIEQYRITYLRDYFIISIVIVGFGLIVYIYVRFILGAIQLIVILVLFFVIYSYSPKLELQNSGLSHDIFNRSFEGEIALEHVRDSLDDQLGN